MGEGELVKNGQMPQKREREGSSAGPAGPIMSSAWGYPSGSPALDYCSLLS